MPAWNFKTFTSRNWCRNCASTLLVTPVCYGTTISTWFVQTVIHFEDPKLPFHRIPLSWRVEIPFWETGVDLEVNRCLEGPSSGSKLGKCKKVGEGSTINRVPGHLLERLVERRYGWIISFCIVFKIYEKTRLVLENYSWCSHFNVWSIILLDIYTK